MTRQLFDVEFDKGGRTYCYHHDGPEQVGPGMIVRVRTRRGECDVMVVATRDEPPKRGDGKPVETSPIVAIVQNAHA